MYGYSSARSARRGLYRDWRSSSGCANSSTRRPTRCDAQDKGVARRGSRTRDDYLPEKALRNSRDSRVLTGGRIGLTIARGYPRQKARIASCIARTLGYPRAAAAFCRLPKVWVRAERSCRGNSPVQVFLQRCLGIRKRLCRRDSRTDPAGGTCAGRSLACCCPDRYTSQEVSRRSRGSPKSAQSSASGRRCHSSPPDRVSERDCCGCPLR